MTTASYIRAIYEAVRVAEPISPFALSVAPTLSGMSMAHLRAALRVALQMDLVKMTPEFELTLGENPPDADREYSPNEVDPGSSTGRPIPDQALPQSGQLPPTAPPKCACPPESQIGSQTPCPCCATQSAIESLSRLVDALSTYQQDASRPDDDRVHQGVTDLLRRVALVRREYELSHRWLLENHASDTSQ